MTTFKRNHLADEPDPASVVVVPGFDTPYDPDTYPTREAWAKAAQTAKTGRAFGWRAAALPALARVLDGQPCLGGCGKELDFRGWCGRPCLPPEIDRKTGLYRREVVLTHPAMREWVESTPHAERIHWSDPYPDVPHVCPGTGTCSPCPDDADA